MSDPNCPNRGNLNKKTTPSNQNILTLLVKMSSFDYLLAVKFIFLGKIPNKGEKYPIFNRIAPSYPTKYSTRNTLTWHLREQYATDWHLPQVFSSTPVFSQFPHCIIISCLITTALSLKTNQHSNGRERVITGVHRNRK